MNDLLKKFGIPTAIGTAISIIVVIVPMLFKIDERYAKPEELEAEVQKLERQNSQLKAELALSTGFQQAMITFIQQGRLPRPETQAEIEARVRAEIAAIESAQRRAAPAPIVSAPATRGQAPQPLPVPDTSKPETAKPQNWRELGDAIKAQQGRLESM